MNEHNRLFTLTVLRETLAIVRLAADAAPPSWATSSEFFSVTRTSDELSVVCPADRIADSIAAERGWRALKVKGPFALSEVGVLAALTANLAASGVSLFAISTFDTDYLLVRREQLDNAVAALQSAGHRVDREEIS